MSHAAARFLHLAPAKDTAHLTRLTVVTPALVSHIEADAPPCAGDSMDALLPANLREQVTEWHDTGPKAWRLSLDASMPVEWQLAPWESMLFRGTPLRAQCIIVRCASEPRSAAAHRRPGKSGWLNCFPADEYDFARAFEPLIDHMRRVPATWAARTIPSLDELFVFAHGDHRGLLDASGSPLDLSGLALPPRVWLLACNVDGAMLRFAHSLLAQGVRAVVVAAGIIDAPAIASLVRDWMAREHEVQPADWLIERHAHLASNDRTTSTLTVFGETASDTSDAARWNLDALRAHTKPQGSSRASIDPAGFREALAALDSPDLWPITAERLLPTLLQLAENQDHEWMTRLERRMHHMASRDGTHALALGTSTYRRGHYEQAAALALEGLKAARHSSYEESQLLGLIANIALSLYLPHVADRAVRRHRRCSLHDVELLGEQEFRRLDWSARIELQCGRLDQALQLMQAKRQRAVDQDDPRELAWLLYIEAWRRRRGLPPETQSSVWCREAFSWLDSHPEGSPGNDPRAYLLRALACLAWTTGDTATRGGVFRAIPELRKGLNRLDPGPHALALGYLALAVGDDSLLDAALLALEHAHYAVEAAVLANARGRDADARRLIEDFCVKRERACDLFAGTEFLHDNDDAELHLDRVVPT